MFPTEWRVFGSVPSRHLTLDKAAGTAPHAGKVIYCWLGSLFKTNHCCAHIEYSVCVNALSLITSPAVSALDYSVYRGVVSVVALLLELLKRPSNCSTGNGAMVEKGGGGGGGSSRLPTARLCLRSCRHSHSPTGLRLHSDTGDSCCLSSRLSISLPLNRLSSSSSEAPLSQKDSCEMKH